MVGDTTWLATSFHDCWRIITLTSLAPVSARTDYLVRFPFLLCFITCNYTVWIPAMVAYKTHRHRLMSPPST